MKHLKHYLIFSIIVLLCSQKVFAEQDLLADEQNTISIFKKIAPYVVNVHRYKTVTNLFSDVMQVPVGTGSGFIWDNQGHIVTNFHVVRGVRKFAITLRDGKVVKAKVIGVAPRKDIAVLKIQNISDISQANINGSLEVADSSKLQVGQKTIAIGNPFGLDHTLTTGIISALGRNIRGIAGVMINDMIQTDASINPGNSGGPLLNSKGELIGMNTLIFSNSGASAGIGFAVPSNTIKRIVSQLIQHGRVIQPSIGVQIVADSVASQFGINGVIIAGVKPNSPAERAGLKGSWRDRSGNIHFGDIIVSINDKRIRKFDDLYSTLEKLKVGQEVDLHYLRNNKIKKVKLRLGDFSEFD